MSSDEIKSLADDEYLKTEMGNAQLELEAFHVFPRDQEERKSFREKMDKFIRAIREDTRARDALRNPIPQFAKLMQRELEANDHKGGVCIDDVDFLLSELVNHVSALERVARRLGAPPGNFACPDLERQFDDECADVANFALLLWEVLGGTYR